LHIKKEKIDEKKDLLHWRDSQNRGKENNSV